ncbi:hypothetical protein [Yokenella regensburgei]|uniref:Uncharacterized protein n=1 Tax=Yokenella regensburgei TaxID=158877 RepID=A0AB38FRC7_9ENTR|nr:hypothetical protein [Yokenella regensburgei]KFD19490.1 hypothetical protein GYRE_04398 [Yokenella regensburgei ATCC 49455]MDQ4431654.1 hypothetical protein [Yokenella regensburgei]RKR65133.1 hypothetical protein C7387_1857 [Yokenella regensburgei]SQA60234.1 Uncharacterised protein [Yokenella regensburgei]SQA67720.1 Uncharacterised protein [Yokenella regensburgei]
MADSFGIRIDYKAGRNRPEKVFEAMAMYINAYEDLIQLLSQTVGCKEEFSFVLDTVEKGSIITYLKKRHEQAVDLVTATILKEVKETSKILKGISTIEGEKQIDEIAEKVDERLTKAFPETFSIAQSEIERKTLARILKRLADANLNMRQDESVDLILNKNKDMAVKLNTHFKFSANLDDLYVEGKIHKNGITDRLFIVKPVNDGNSRWDCKSLNMNQRFDAVMMDKIWLERYQTGLIPAIGPSDIMLAKMNLTIKTKKDSKLNKVLHAEIFEVIDIIKNSEGMKNESLHF